MKLNATLFFFFSAVAMAESGGSPPSAVCPLSDSQSKKSIEAFSKLVPTLTEEPRCTGCHGRVNPFIDGIGEEKGQPGVVESVFEHGGGKMERGHIVDNMRVGATDCDGCHDNMPKRGRGGKSIWMLAPDELAFIGKDARTLCEQIRDNIALAENFVGHLRNDNGFNNFTGAAFNGDRALNRGSYPESEVPTQIPTIKHAELLKLGQDWVATTDGKFQGDKTCGCEPAHYAIRVNILNEMNMGPVHLTSALPPMDIPITFADDGTFKGDGEFKFHGAGTAGPCTAQTGSTLDVHVSGQAKETVDEHSMHVQFEQSSPTVTSLSAECPYADKINNQAKTAQTVTLPFDFTGNVGEALDYKMPGVPSVVSTMHVEIVKRE